MKLSVIVILFLCLGCSKNAYQIDRNTKLEPQVSLDAAQFSNEASVLKSAMKTKNDSSNVIVVKYDSKEIEATKTKKDSIQR